MEGNRTSTTKGPTAELVVVTPALAAEWLAKNTDNRNLRPAVANAYSRDMESGEWIVTGDGIRFDIHGNLIDGQHRLMGVLRSDANVPMFVFRGLPREAKDVMDSGVRRTPSDMLRWKGYKNTSTLAASARLMLNLLAADRSTGKIPNGQITNTELNAYIEENEDLIEAARMASFYKAKIALDPAVVAVLWFEFSHIDASACGEFFDGIANNATDGASDARSALILRLASALRKGERLSKATQINFGIRSWNAWRRGKSIGVLKAYAVGKNGSMVAVAIPEAI